MRGFDVKVTPRRCHRVAWTRRKAHRHPQKPPWRICCKFIYIYIWEPPSLNTLYAAIATHAFQHTPSSSSTARREYYIRRRQAIFIYIKVSCTIFNKWMNGIVGGVLFFFVVVEFFPRWPKLLLDDGAHTPKNGWLSTVRNVVGIIAKYRSKSYKNRENVI